MAGNVIESLMILLSVGREGGSGAQESHGELPGRNTSIDPVQVGQDVRISVARRAFSI